MERSLAKSWGSALIQELIDQGVDYFCLSPGFRSSPLALAAAQNPKARSFVHYDERGMAFHALGYAKVTKKPVAIIVTSGSAVGNLMPALMEAYHNCVSLVLLTSDRPHELRDTKANQTADQIKIFGDYVHHFVDLPRPQAHLPDRFLTTTIAQSVSRSLYPIKGPVQINCPFNEPFFDETEGAAFSDSPIHYFQPTLQLNENASHSLVSIIESCEKGVIIAGENAKGLEKLVQRLRWPLLADVTSFCRHLSLPYYHHLIKSAPELRADLILHLGGPFVSKELLHWMSKQKAASIIHVSENPKRCDPMHIVTEKVICPTEVFCETIEPLISQKSDDWLIYWQELSKKIEKELLTQINEQETLTEPGITKIVEELAPDDQALFFGNSMPIRDADMFFFPKHAPLIFANRGLSGIDGHIATIAGIAQHQRVIAIIGDQTCLHDLNSLAQLQKVKHPVKLIVINNKGGGIFSFVAINLKQEALESHFVAAHEYTFEKAAKLFHIPYCQLRSKKELKYALEKPGVALIEISTTRTENLHLHQQLDQKASSCLSSCMVS